MSRNSVIWRLDFASTFIAILFMIRWKISPKVLKKLPKISKVPPRLGLTEKDKDVLAAIKEQHNITQTEIAAKLGLEVDHVKYYFNKMKY